MTGNGGAGNGGSFAGQEFRANIKEGLAAPKLGMMVTTTKFTGMTTRRIVCKNLTTGKSKVIAGNADTWNCEAAGLKVKPGDKVWMTVKGVANTAP